ncbi:MAG TPA: 3-oxoacyl-ACP synthase III [Thermoanaerobaculales bacterium]|nr:3-oxoacyl-ACP synthase III [Thermoanaerobaculales bacterium]HPA82047.1 3-oxoacyl-ACP synthase III [Thermoanaerobaculales bacterium]HQL30211.1 3-oxoacyl-ACP synthase III [Thermoanaerobaculales bacterium]HQN96180.1 3-oxoacyl-ACP synthase III [Thermoanaerobaculales bacterium]HQP43096.1 3-oxoacyl-ACP synthase III [Thermoanaerobaculales bacterium]
MRFDNVSILSVEHVDAPQVLTSAEIEARLQPAIRRLGVRPNLLVELSGIVERQLWEPGTECSDPAIWAGERAIESAGIDRSRIGVLVNTSVTRDYLEPSNACAVHDGLALSEDCQNFDVSNACLGFVNGMDIVGNMIERGEVDYGLVVDAESTREMIDATVARLLDERLDEATFRENFASLTLGSGAVAMVMGRSALAANGHRYQGGVSLSATRHWRLCRGNMDHMVTDTQALTEAGLRLCLRTWQRATEVLGWTTRSHVQYAQHQVSKGHAEKFAAMLGLDMEKIYRLYPTYGNVGPAGIAIVLSKLAAEGTLVAGDRVALMGIGSGVNCTMAEIVW